MAGRTLFALAGVFSRCRDCGRTMFALGEDVLAVVQESAFSKTSLLKEPLDLLSNAQRQTFELKSVQRFFQGQFGLA